MSSTSFIFHQHRHQSKALHTASTHTKQWIKLLLYVFYTYVFKYEKGNQSEKLINGPDREYVNIITCCMAIDGVWIGNRIYWTILQLVSTLHRSLPHTVFSFTLLGSGFQRRTFLCFRTHALLGWRPSHANLLHWPLTSAGTSFNTLFFQITKSSQDLV
jgi:hypothetical protein